MEVTLVGSLPPLRGVSYYCIKISETLSKKINVEFIAFKKLYPDFFYPKKHSYIVDKDFSISENNSLKIYTLLTYYNPVSWLRAGLKGKSKIVHLQWWSIPIAPIYIFLSLFYKLRSKKVLLTIHNIQQHEPSYLDKALSKILFSFVDHFIVHSIQNKKDAYRFFNLDPNNISVIPMGIHDMYNDDSATKEESRKILGLPMDSKVVLYFGNIRDYKGVDDLIKAFYFVNKKIKNTFL